MTRTRTWVRTSDLCRVTSCELGADGDPDERDDRGRNRRRETATLRAALRRAATNWATADAGGGHTCAVKTTGRLYCWGYDYYGQLGNDRPNTNQRTPVEVSSP